MNDEEYTFVTDCAEKKRTAWGAHNKRSHTGKGGGRINFPSDYLSKEERQKMNGECVTYSLNRPMKWQEFKRMPDDIRRQYIEGLQARFDVMQIDLAEMFGVTPNTIGLETKKLGIKFKHRSGLKINTNKGAWRVFCAGLNTPVKPPEKVEPESAPEVIDEPKQEREQKTEPVREVKNLPSVCTPVSGNLAFTECTATDALNTAFAVLGRGEYAAITIAWSKGKIYANGENRCADV